MLDFLLTKHRTTQKGTVEVYPDFRVGRSKDLMIRSGAFYAIWDQDIGLWSTDEYYVQTLVDRTLSTYAEKLKETTELPISIRFMSDFSSTSWTSFKLFLTKLADQSEQLDNRVTFSNSVIIKKDYVSKRLTYPIEATATPAFDKLFGTLYDEDNLTKIKWAIGSIIEGSSKKIQKFFVLYGSPGTGKSTLLNLIQSLFYEYYTTFEAQMLTDRSNNFSTEIFRNNPLIGINHEGDLSRIKDNSVLSSLVSHDRVVMKVKYQHSYDIRLNTLLFIATNKPVSITDAKSGLIRRLIDIRPTGNKLPVDEYDSLVNQLEFELGGIAQSCLDTFNRLGKSYYNRYQPVDMMLRTNTFFNFVDEYFYEFSKDDFITLARAWELYKEYCTSSNIEYKLQRHIFRDEFKNYWNEFIPYKRVDGAQLRSVYEGFNKDLFLTRDAEVESIPYSDWLSMTEQPSLLDRLLIDCKAQYEGVLKHWDNVKKTLKSLDTSKVHYVLPVPQLVTIDFDLKDSSGNKSLELNLEAAKRFPRTYAEVSKGGFGLHLHYFYDGDISLLSRVYEPGIEVLAPVGKFSIRRRLSICNNQEVARISSGLPLKETLSVINKDVVKSERGLRLLVLRNLNKEIHPATKPSVDFIYTILSEANTAGVVYDLSDLKPAVLNFASNSTNNAEHCIKVALKTPYISTAESQELTLRDIPRNGQLTFFDVEVVPNLLLICWKYQGPEASVQRMYNPTPAEIEPLLQHNLVGYNCRRYDNHILKARFLGFDNAQLFELSSRIIENDRTALFRDAYDISYTDVFDYSSVKKSLKQWEIDLGILHHEWDKPWYEPLPESEWPRLGDYCADDVEALEIVHDHLSEDFHARLILSELSGLTPNDTTQSHTARIVFGNDKNPQGKFKYTDLSETFPGYRFDRGVSTYRDIKVGEGGLVYSEPGVYHNVLYADIASMHPTSIVVLDMFGPYTKRYEELLVARKAVKDGRLKEAATMLENVLKPYLRDPAKARRLAYSLKIALNIVYGLTSASFSNAFRDHRNKDNIVAKRGSLFMVDLLYALKDRGASIIHIKTDSVKVANHTKEDLEFIQNFARKYGYEFGVEGVFEKMLLTTKADLIAKWGEDGTKKGGKWYAVGATFGMPYVFKTLFSKEPIEFADLIETKSVKKGMMYIELEGSGELMFVGRVGAFCPVKDGCGGGTLWAVMDDDRRTHVNGSTGYNWIPAYLIKDQEYKDLIDYSFFNAAVDDIVEKIAKYGDPTLFLD